MDTNSRYGGAAGGSGGRNNDQQIASSNNQQQQSSLTIEEMRHLHRSAITEAESKRTELRLVLASRYRELVGSSDEVIHMHSRALELHELITALPSLVEKVVVACSDNHGLLEEEAVKENEESNNKTRKELFKDDKNGGSATATRENVESVLRWNLSRLPPDIHRRLDIGDVHGAASLLIALFDIIAHQSSSSCWPGGDHPYPLAIALSSSLSSSSSSSVGEQIESNTNSPMLEVQFKMTYLHVQTLPSRTVKMARKVLLRSASSSLSASSLARGAYATASALSALDLLDINRGNINDDSVRAIKLVDLYYESKAALINRLLNKLTLPTSSSSSSSSSTTTTLDAASVTNRAGVILSKIVMILQYDVILYPYQIFILRKFRIDDDNNGDVKNEECHSRRKLNNNEAAEAAAARIVYSIMSTLPHFDHEVIKSKTSRFLAAHLPLIREKVKSVLMMIAGTTASKLGSIRQTLYDKTDGFECMAALDSCGVCHWDEAVGGMVDVRLVSTTTTTTSTPLTTTGGSGPGTGVGGDDSSSEINATATAAAAATTRRFSLWGALFSNTFSSLVHSLLTSSFQSVHVSVVSTLRASLSRAPPFESMLPHEAHRNALRIATDLDASLRRVSDDAHELLVHAEEREESERRLRQSLYVQTCEIMGRLLNELRRMLVVGGGGGGGGETVERNEDATKVFIVGRLCHLLKFRLKSLPTLLDPASSPAVMLAAGLGGGGKTHSGMITLMELSSSFDLADDDDDGLISFDEAMEAMESAFSGTHFHGAEVVRDTLLLTNSAMSNCTTNHTGASYLSSAHNKSTPQNVTLSELALLSARGLRHDVSGPESALGTVQSSLDVIVNRCFKEWARAALSSPMRSFTKTLQEQMDVAMTVSDLEWRRLNGLLDKEDDVLLKEIIEAKGDKSKLEQGPIKVGEVSPNIVSYLLTVAGVLNRSVCPTDLLPPVPSLEYAKKLGILSRPNDSSRKGIPNMLVTIRGSLLGEALTSISQSLKQEIMSSREDNGVTDDAGYDERLKKCSPSSLVQLYMDVKFIHQCFFERNNFGFLLASDSVNDSRRIIDSLSECTSASLSADTRDISTINNSISEKHARVFNSSHLFLSSLFGEDQSGKFLSDLSASMTGISSSESMVLNPLPSSRRFILLPIQAEKSLTELQLRGKYEKKAQEEKASGKDTTTGTLGSGFGFLSSMLTKTR